MKLVLIEALQVNTSQSRLSGADVPHVNCSTVRKLDGIGQHSFKRAALFECKYDGGSAHFHPLPSSLSFVFYVFRYCRPKRRAADREMRMKSETAAAVAEAPTTPLSIIVEVTGMNAVLPSAPVSITKPSHAAGIRCRDWSQSYDSICQSSTVNCISGPAKAHNIHRKWSSTDFVLFHTIGNLSLQLSSEAH